MFNSFDSIFSKWHVIRMIFRLRMNMAPLFDFYCFWKSQARLEFNCWIRPDWDLSVQISHRFTNTKSWEYFTDNPEHSMIKTYNCIQFIHFFHNAVNRLSKKVHYCKLICLQVLTVVHWVLRTETNNTKYKRFTRSMVNSLISVNPFLRPFIHLMEFLTNKFFSKRWAKIRRNTGYCVHTV